MKTNALRLSAIAKLNKQNDNENPNKQNTTACYTDRFRSIHFKWELHEKNYKNFKLKQKEGCSNTNPKSALVSRKQRMEEYYNSRGRHLHSPGWEPAGWGMGAKQREETEHR